MRRDNVLSATVHAFLVVSDAKRVIYLSSINLHSVCVKRPSHLTGQVVQGQLLCVRNGSTFKSIEI
jgi:hypothetical protein